MTISVNNVRVYLLSEAFRSFYFTVPIYLAFLQERLSISQISILVGWSFLVQLVMELPTGALADLLGKRITIILSYILDTIFFVGYSFITSFPMFLLIATIGGLAESLRSGASEAMVYDSLKEDGKEHNFAKVGAKQGVLFQIGLIIATLLGGFIYEFNIHLPYILAGLAQAASGLSTLFYREPKVDTVTFTVRNYLRQIKLGAKEAFKSREHRLMSLYYIAVGAISWLVMTYYVDYLLIDLGFDHKVRGIISAGTRTLNILIISKILVNEKILDRKRTLIFFPILLVLSLTPGLWLQGWWGVPFIAGAMMSSTARWILLGKYTNQVFESKYRATAISTLSMAIGATYVIFTFFSGPFMELYGGSRAILTLLGIISLITIPPLAYKLIKLNP